MAVPYLQVDNLTKSFGDLVLFENISFGIAEGQRVGLIAKNGSGKTILLNIPTLEVMINGKRSPLMVAVAQTTASLYKCFTGELRRIIYPEK